MNWHYVLRFTLATGSAVMFPDSDTISGIITYVDAPKSALLVYVPVAPGVGQYTGVIGGKILWLIRPKAKIGTRKT